MAFGDRRRPTRGGIKAALSEAAKIITKNRSAREATEIRISILKLAFLVRRTCRESEVAIGRAELRGILENTLKLSERLSRCLKNRNVSEALNRSLLACADPDIRRATQVVTENTGFLHDLQIAVSSACAALKLTGRAGRSGPYQRVRLSAKVLLSIYARQLFVELKITKKRPTVRNENLVQFLDSVWTLATNASDSVNDWSTPLKVAQARRSAGTDASAHLTARLEGADFANRLCVRLEAAKRGPYSRQKGWT
jgi:hypothetical protein